MKNSILNRCVRAVRCKRAARTVISCNAVVSEEEPRQNGKNGKRTEEKMATDYGFVRVAAVTPDMRVADVKYNAGRIAEKLEECAKRGVQIAVFPELALSGYTCSDLFLQPLLPAACLQALQTIAEGAKESGVLAFIGLPLVFAGKLYNVAAAVCGGKILAFVPKRHLPNYGEFYEQRQFTAWRESDGQDRECFVTVGAERVPFGGNILLCAENIPDLAVGCEICEDLWSTVPPSCALARQGATVVVNLSASNEVIGKKEYRTMLVQSQSGRCICGYVYASSGIGESTTDAVFGGHCLIAENGTLLAENRLFEKETLLLSEIDVQKLACERRKTTTFETESSVRRVSFSVRPCSMPLNRRFSRTPFVPSDGKELKERADLILAMQANALAKRLRHTGAKCAVVGISGGLDSTLALLVTARAFDIVGRPRKEIVAVTMPGFGTTSRTHDNALRLIDCVGATSREIDITKSVLCHFEDIGQDREKTDVTYENAQARMRTLILMDVANKEGGLVIGTGDLSELALGWCTYNGDHMSMYAVNSSVPKTLVKYLVKAVGTETGGELQTVLEDVLNTEISPELLPPDKSGKIAQKTEDLIGPYELHDFFLYHVVRWGFSPKKVFFLARTSFAGAYDEKTVLKWLKNFYRRFFSQQFKRSCMPDGVKIGSVTLSPRADWRMPSDAQATLWLSELENITLSD